MATTKTATIVRQDLTGRDSMILVNLTELLTLGKMALTPKVLTGFDCHGNDVHNLNHDGTVAGFIYECRAMTYANCQRVEESDYYGMAEVVKWTPGKRCHEIHCEESCGCYLGGQSYSLGEEFTTNCQTCKCNWDGSLECTCTHITTRQSIHTIPYEELMKYQNAIKTLAANVTSNKW
ncbi:unnamed protein product, partial [Owenia fusiformis]